MDKGNWGTCVNFTKENGKTKKEQKEKNDEIPHVRAGGMLCIPNLLPQCYLRSTER